MKLPVPLRTVATILVAVFLLTTLWAGYYVYEQSHARSSSSPRVVAVYSETGSNGFVAALLPSYLYNNSTEIAGGNITLFSAITTWINVSMYYSVLVNRSAAISLEEAFEVRIGNPVWSKTLFTSSNSSSVSGGYVATLVTRFSVNVGGIVALAQEINSQVGYPANAFSLSLIPSISGSVTAGGETQSIGSAPGLNFSFNGPLIAPQGLSYNSNGTLDAPPAPPSGGNTATSYAALILSIAGLAGAGWFVARPREKAAVPLRELIAPYEELIADTAATPKGEVTVPVAEFPDLVKIADTLGKPILRPIGSEPGRTSFIVLDGSIAYAYWHAGPDARPAGESPHPSSLPLMPIVPSSETSRITRLQGEADRLRGLSLDERTDREARRRIRRAIDLIHAHDGHGADREIDDLSRLLDRAELRSTANRS